MNSCTQGEHWCRLNCSSEWRVGDVLDLNDTDDNATGVHVRLYSVLLVLESQIHAQSVPIKLVDDLHSKFSMQTVGPGNFCGFFPILFSQFGSLSLFTGKSIHFTLKWHCATCTCEKCFAIRTLCYFHISKVHSLEHVYHLSVEANRKKALRSIEQR